MKGVEKYLWIDGLTIQLMDVDRNSISVSKATSGEDWREKGDRGCFSAQPE
ncbi:hypothetical protein ACP26L_07445 [Paenibacillus sp. S-38]|uniref:hypothetical protein n=1 Tax=Paenibacillus sp. S-38 TaxID=3416710 RepID=UPI003CFAB4E2